MASIWPSLGRQVHVTTRLFGEVALVVLLGVTLAGSWRDGVPVNDYVGPVTPIQTGIALTSVSGNNLYSGKPFLVPKPPVAAPIVERPIPTALPVRLLVPSLDIHPPVESLGVDRFGAMDTPNNIWDVGWYNAGPVPGAPGDAVINGHAGYPGQPLIFGRLVKLQQGEQIVVVLADGSKQIFSVDSVTSYPLPSMPAGMFEPYGPPRLTLITCDGKFNSANKTYASRLIVEASYVGQAP